MFNTRRRNPDDGFLALGILILLILDMIISWRVRILAPFLHYIFMMMFSIKLLAAFLYQSQQTGSMLSFVSDHWQDVG